MNSPETPQTVYVGEKPRIALACVGVGPLLLFLHGIGGNRSNWRGQLAYFGERFTAVAWDARGYGGSDDYEGPLDFGDFSQDLLRVIDYFGVEKAHLVGLSMGARIGFDFYGRYPERVASLVLADTSIGKKGVRKEEQIEEAIRTRQAPLLGGKEPADLAQGLAERLTGPGVSDEVFAEVKGSLAAVRKESYLKTLATVIRYEGFPPFESVRVPCLVMVGEDDPLATPEVCGAMAAQIPGARFGVVTGAGHLSNMENGEGFNRVLDEFLGEVVGDG